ncbi:MAG: EAL domain-containing protein [Candidatus Thiodiazotropha sp.]
MAPRVQGCHVRSVRLPLLFLLMLAVLALVLSGNYWREIEVRQRFLMSAQEMALTSRLQSYQRLVEVLNENLFTRPEVGALLAEANQADETQQTRLRERLYHRFHPTFRNLKRNDFRALQFVLANGRSFLRFNLPELHGDPIARRRPILQQALTGGSPSPALETGGIYPGYRFAYPIRHDGQVVGAVDFCLSFEAILQSLSKVDGYVDSYNRFMLKKGLLEAAGRPKAAPGDLYRESHISPDYVVEEPAEGEQRLVESIHRQLRSDAAVQRALQQGAPVSKVVCRFLNSCHAVILRPVEDSMQRTAGYILSYIPMEGVVYLQRSHLAAFLVGTLLIGVTVLALRRWLDTNNRLRTISDHMAEGMYVMDEDGAIIYVNPTACEILRYPEEQLIGMQAHRLFHTLVDGTEHTPVCCPIRSRVQAGRIFRSEEEQFRCRDGTVIRVSIVGSPLWSNDLLSGCVVLFRDITAEYEVRLRLQRSDVAFSSLAEAVMVTAPDGTIQAVNRAFTQITGYGEDEVIGNTPRLLKSGRHDADFYQALWDCLISEGRWEGDVWNRRKCGEIYPEHLRIVAVKGSGEVTTGFVATFSDVTEIRRQEQTLRQLAYHDPLTGLHNRAAFLEMFEHALGHAERRQTRLALLYLDLDRFKKINDTLGHVIGDQVLEESAERLRQVVRSDDEVARLGGDEFIIMLEDFAHVESPARVARKTLSLLGQPIYIGPHILQVTTSIGIAIYPDDGQDATSLLKNADAAMYMAKREGRNGFHYFTQTMAEKAENRLNLEIDLHTALLNEEFRLYYQPKIDLTDGRVTGLEALLRWEHPQRGLLTPESVLKVAHDAGVMRDITHWVITESCRQLQEWLDAGLQTGRIAINVDAHTFNSRDAYDQIGRTVEVTGIPPSLVELEIPESGLLEKRFDDEFWRHLVEMGFELSIDDFGIGESSLLRLKHLPVTTLKIDRSFIRDIDSDDNDRAIIRTVVAMGQSLGVRVLAEGVEDVRQLRYLREIGCDEVQGHLLSPPLPAEQIPALLAARDFAGMVETA